MSRGGDEKADITVERLERESKGRQGEEREEEDEASSMINGVVAVEGGLVVNKIV